MNSNLRLKRQYGLVSLLAVMALVLAACAPVAATQAPAALPTQAPAPTTAATAPVPVTGNGNAPASVMVNMVDNPQFGKILVDSKGMTLYVFGKDTPDKSNCSGGCAKAWPALVTSGTPQAGTGVDASMLGTAALADGSKIVTYNHMPLYYYAADSNPGETNGQNVGKVWWVESVSGQPVKGQAAPAAATAVSTTAASSSASTVMIQLVDNPQFGKILADGKGMTLYLFMKDAPDKSNCSAGCLKAWPALVSSGTVTVGPGLDASLLGSADLPDGSKIVTYNHVPLYYFASDSKPGETNGQNVGKVWFVVGPDGKPVQAAAAAPTSKPASSNSSGGGYTYP